MPASGRLTFDTAGTRDRCLGEYHRPYCPDDVSHPGDRYLATALRSEPMRPVVRRAGETRTVTDQIVSRGWNSRTPDSE